jgi:ribosomal protein S3
MGQKVHPIGIRLGIVKDWTSKWYADTKMFPEYIRQDYLLRTLIKKKLKDASVSKITIERPSKKVNITIHTARPGIVIGKKGEDIEKLRSEVAHFAVKSHRWLACEFLTYASISQKYVSRNWMRSWSLRVLPSNLSAA